MFDVDVNHLSLVIQGNYLVYNYVLVSIIENWTHEDSYGEFAV